MKQPERAAGAKSCIAELSFPPANQTTPDYGTSIRTLAAEPEYSVVPFFRNASAAQKKKGGPMGGGRTALRGAN